MSDEHRPRHSQDGKALERAVELGDELAALDPGAAHLDHTVRPLNDHAPRLVVRAAPND